MLRTFQMTLVQSGRWDSCLSKTTDRKQASMYMYLVRNLCDSEIGFKFNHEMSQTWHIFSFRCLMNYYCVPWVISSTYSVKKKKEKKQSTKSEPNE